jgi:hypothetical protein
MLLICTYGLSNSEVFKTLVENLGERVRASRQG